MSLLNTFKSLFGTNSEPKAATSETYKNFIITPMPRKEGAQYRVYGTIQKDGKQHLFIRADLLASEDECIRETLRKAKLTIDQSGESILS